MGAVLSKCHTKTQNRSSFRKSFDFGANIQEEQLEKIKNHPNR